ncbi:MAG: hypothetical protein H7A23_23500 [Leptospiraceae bacterium]|nr:hypothetical protein [Leptospiraceae bacterium]MCP5497529.1 hypothetical protein [Leptospiraceae bacterium]
MLEIGEKYYFQDTGKGVKEREYGNLLEIKDNFKKIVITADQFHETNYYGIEIWNIIQFCMELF